MKKCVLANQRWSGLNSDLVCKTLNPRNLAAIIFLSTAKQSPIYSVILSGHRGRLFHHLGSSSLNLFRSALHLMLLLGLLLVAAYADSPADRTDVKRDQRQIPETTYKIQAGLEGEIYPVFANYASLQKQDKRTQSVVSVTVSNPGNTPLRQRMAVQIVGWSDQEIQVADVGAKATQTFVFAPAFLPRFYQNHEIVAATAHVSVSDMAGRSVYETTMPVRLRSSEHMYCGSSFKDAPFIASWVTPHNAHVEAILAQAKELTPDRRLPGYEPWNNPTQQDH